MPGFMESQLEDAARQRLVREMDVIQSEFPLQTSAHRASGFCIPGSGSCSILLSVPSSRWFKPRLLWVHNRGNTPTELQFFAAGSAADASVTLGGMWLQGTDTQFIAWDTLTVNQDLWAMNVSGHSVMIRVGGLLLNSGPE